MGSSAFGAFFSKLEIIFQKIMENGEKSILCWKKLSVLCSVMGHLPVENSILPDIQVFCLCYSVKLKYHRFWSWDKRHVDSFVADFWYFLLSVSVYWVLGIRFSNVPYKFYYLACGQFHGKGFYKWNTYMCIQQWYKKDGHWKYLIPNIVYRSKRQDQTKMHDIPQRYEAHGLWKDLIPNICI